MSVTATTAARAGAFSPRTVLVLLLVGVFSFSAFMMLSAFEPELSRDDNGQAHALSRSGLGFAAALRLTRETGVNVTVSRTQGASGAPLVVFTPETKHELDEYLSRARQRALIILPKWIGMPDPRHPGWVVRLGPLPEDGVSSVVQPFYEGLSIVRRAQTATPQLAFTPELGSTRTQYMPGGEIEALQTLTGPGLVPVVVDETGAIVLARLQDYDFPAVYVLADPDFLNTHGVSEVETARAGIAMLNLLRAPEDSIAFDVTLNGFARSRSLLRLAFEPPFLAATLSLVAAAALLAWRAATRQRPKAHERRAIALGKRTLAENSAALIRMARREHRMGWGYAQLTSAQVAELIGAGRGESAEAMAQLDRVGQAAGVSRKFSDLAAEAAGAQTRAQMLTAARHLHSWREEMLRATR